MRRSLHVRIASGIPLHRVFVVAAPSRAVEILTNLDEKGARYQPAGVWHLQGGELDPDPKHVIDRAQEAGADTILFVPLGSDDTRWTRELCWAAENSDLSVLVSLSLAGIAGPRLSVDPVEDMAFVRVSMPRFAGPAQVAKRALDIVGATFGLIVLAPLMLLVAVLIRRDSAGPAIFKQVRAGIGMSTFECWKFRTMYTGADAERAALRKAQQDTQAGELDADGLQSATFKMADDPRITRVGHRLRKYSIDELPQLLNVLRGEMSLVGPRPHPMDDVQLYDAVAHRRLLAKPGMTGLWQVSGRSDLDWDKAVGLDLFYVENWSFAADLLILLRTVKVVLKGSGAY
jgi:exopolysaccharide biosynthesis polyprenyl glycosylphosphotransferase